MTRGIPGPIRAENRREIMRQTLKAAERQGWDREYTVLVLDAQLAPTRVECGVTGPCTYCGTWIASVVDHVTPLARGGEHIQSNVTSACAACNSSKSDYLLNEWPAYLKNHPVMSVERPRT